MAAVFALALLLLAAPARAALPDYSQPGPFPAAQRQIAVSGVNNAQFTAEVFYPGTAAAVNGTKLPILSYAHGYLGPVVTYVSFLRHLASWGILSVATNSEGGPTPNQTQYAYDILSCFDAVASDPFFAPAIDLNKKAVGGHSMGGGSSIAAAWLDKQQNNGSTTLKAYLGHAAAGSRLLVDGQNLTAVQLIRDLDLPIRLVSATGDTIVPYATNLAMYNNASNAPAQLVGVEGAGHCAFIDIEFTVPLCGAETLPRATARPLIRKLSTEFLLLHQNGLPPNPDANGPNELWNAVWGPGLQNQPQYITANLSDPKFSLVPSGSSSVVLRSTFPTQQVYSLSANNPSTLSARNVTLPGNGSVTIASGDNVPAGIIRAVRITTGDGDGVTGGVLQINGTTTTTTRPSGAGRDGVGAQGAILVVAAAMVVFA